ncbi:protein phosphatase 1 regulatory subunit 12C isoform X2 [Salarias fasciatus]|uniref:protein phosphatase 1 regulatory subunit 12C isoform X2 n=1 Tax=Salarias fasciatus TaxID=181472 RepID=UPI0011769E01|nr:protein phosphatase 1 regulatory subunit 12C-like isoform X2 [Salarias fasciatus]
MGDSARTKRREQLKRWTGSCTDRASDVPRRRKRVRFDRAAEFLAACASGDTKEAQAMLEEVEAAGRKSEGAVTDIINCSNADGITALHQACIDGSMDIVAFLWEHGASVNQVDNEGWTPLHVAASCGYPEIADFLLQKGASISAVNCDGDVPVDIALDETTESLLQHHSLRQGVDLDAVKRLEEEQMMSDARIWLTDGAPADVQNPKTGATPLHVAAAKGYLEALKILCQCGLDVSAVDLDGWTPLHAAAHWGQGEACRVLAEQLCNMEARSNGGQTPFDVADESVEELLEELSQKQANWRNERSVQEPQNPPGPGAANTQGKKRRSSVCRMSSKDKMTVQDQSKERGVSGGLELSEERENSPETSTSSSPDPDAGTTSAAPHDQTLQDREEEEQKEEQREYDKAVARVQPTPQNRDSAADSPNTPSSDHRKFQAPVRDEESESQRRVRSRLMRQSRRSTQGVTMTDLKEAEKCVGRGSDPPPRSVQSVSPIVTITPAERDTDPVKPGEPEGDRRLGVRSRRRTRTERRSTGIIQPGEENDDGDAPLDDSGSNDSSHGSLLGDLSGDYRVLYYQVLQENLRLKDKLQEMELQLSQNKVELERLRQTQESSSERPALLELERFEKLALQRKAVEMEDDLKVLGDLKADNQRLKDENAALIRVISKLSR